MSDNICLIMTPQLKELYNKVWEKYPEQCKRTALTESTFLGWVETYNKQNGKQPDFIPEAEALVNNAEKNKNKEGKSFKYTPYTVTYTYQNRKQTYSIRGTHIYNKEGKEIFLEDTKDRRKIFANLAVQQGRAVIVEHKNRKYVVNNRNQIVSVTTGDEMKWGEENGDRKEILRLSQIAFREKQKAETTTTNSNVATEDNENYVKQLVDHLKSSGVNVLDRAAMNKFFKEHPNTLIQQALEEQWEMQDIKAKAIANGTFMKAPNGKDTNLTERQWLQVRTKAFKAWFGDWEGVAEANRVSLGKILPNNDKYARYGQKGETDVEIREVLDENGKIIGTVRMEFSGKNRNGVVTLHPQLSITGKGYGTALYQHIANTYGIPVEESFGEIGKSEAGKALWNKLQRKNNAQISKGDVPLRQILPTNASKVVDENGEPLVVYHYSNDVNLTKFSTSFDNYFSQTGGTKNAIFFTEDNPSDDERKNNFLTKRKNKIAVFLSIKDLKTYSGTKEYLHKQGTSYREVVNKSAEENSVDRGLHMADFDDNKKEHQSIWIVHNPNQIKSATDNNGMFSTENDDIQMAIFGIDDHYLNSKYIDTIPELQTIVKHNKYNKAGTDAVILESDPSIIYIIDHSNNEEFEVHKREDRHGVGIRSVYKLKDLKDDEIKEIIRNISSQYDYSEARIRSLLQNIGLTKEHLHSIDIDAELQRVIDSNNKIYGRDRSKWPSEGYGSGRYYNNGSRRSKAIEGNLEQESFFITPEGEVYGFVDKDGNIYLDETIIDASHPIHEYTHLWDRALEKTNPQLWKRGVNLMQEGVPGLWNEIANSENYGKLWQSKGIKGEKLINLIASEVHARLVGENGAKLLDQIAKEKGNEGIIVKLKQWILDAWKELKTTFSNWSQEEIDKLTLKDFNHMTVRDFADGINPNTISSSSNASPDNLAANAASLGTITREDVERDNQRLREKEAQAIERAQMQANKPLPERPKSATIESALTTKETPLSKFKRTFSPQQIKDRGAMISDLFSNIIDEYIYDSMDKCLETIESDTATEEEKQEAQEILSKLRDPLKGRQYAAQEKGIGVIANEILQMFEYFRDSAKDDKKVLYQNTIDFFEELFESQASLDIEEREGIRIVGLKAVDKTATEEENEDNDNGDDEVGNVATGSDGWNFKVRYEDPFSRLSKKVRGMLYEVDMPASEVDDLGYQRKYPMGRIYASLLSFLSSNMESADDFIQIDKSYEGKDNWGNDITENTYPNGYPTFPVLEKMRGMYPLVEQIIQRLTDDYLNPEWNTSLRYPSTGGAMASQFYTNFRNVLIPYGKIQLGENNLNNITPLNYAMEDRVQYDKLVANYNNRIVLSPHSIYDAGGKINKENAEYISRLIDIVLYDIDKTNLINYIQHPDAYKDDTTSIERYEKDIDKLRDILQSFGIEATTDGIVAYAYMNDGKALRTVLEKLGYIDSLIRKVDDSKVDEFNYILDTRNPYGENMWTHFFDGIGMISDSSYMQSFYDSASHKTKYSYSADNYLMKRFRGICMGTVEQRRKYINENFGKYDWFRDQRQPEGKGWRNAWLEFWYNYGEKFNGNQRELPYKNIDNITESDNYGNVKIRPYVKWEPGDIWEVQERSYDAESKKETAYYLSPIFSDSPMSMTVLGPKLDMGRLLYGYLDNENKRRQGALVQLINQELVRIQLVQNREQQIKDGKIKAISNFDTGCGKLFCFLPELNFYTFEDTGESFLDRIIRLKKEKASLSEIEALQIKALTDIIDAKMNEYLYENDYKYQNREPITREQYYNMVYADAAIIQLTTVDLAFYGKGQRGSVNETLNNIMIDFQKRFKEVYAGGIQLNTNSKYGKKAENVLLIKDDVITSPSYTYIANIIDGSEHLTQEDKNYIKSTFTDINVADAQAIRSMHSFRSVFDMMGKWTDEMEQALQHFKEGTWKREDFDVIFQVIKPFVYSVIERNAGNGSSILVPQQNKNSEICALMMYDLISNGLNKSSVYKAFSRFMEDTVDGEGNHLIDMIQYESAGKVGNQGVVNISFNPSKVVDLINGDFYDTKEGNEVADIIDSMENRFYPAYKNGKYLDNTINNAEDNYKAIKGVIDELLHNKEISQDNYNKVLAYLRPTEDEIISMLEQAALITNPDGTKSINEEVVHTIPFDNYYQQQPTPEHHIDAEAVYGSQERNIAVADLPENLELTLPGKRGNKTLKGKDAIIDFYYELLNENLIEDFFGKGNKKGLKGIFESKESLRDAVTEIVRGNPKYSKDFADALKIDPETGKFVLNPNSPTVFTLMQEIVTSFFKNRITKQKINGAALIQAAGIGLDESLRIEFDKKGKLLGAHCLMPLTSKRFFEPLLQEKTINGKKVKVLDPEVLKKAGLDKAVGYRIPTENKSSMMPLIIDGFTPLQNGSAIVLPAEITNIAGSDFDVDKMFIMLLSFYVQEYNKAKARKDFAKINPTYTASLEFLEKVGLLNEEEDAGLSEDEDRKFNEWFDANKDKYLLDKPIIRKIKYDFSKSPKENSRKARNNMLIQMTFEILRSKEGSESLFNPQGFKDAKRAAKITKVITNPELFNKYAAEYDYNTEDAVAGLLKESTKKIEKFINKYSTPESPVFPQTFAHSHARNMAGVNQIGIYAIQASMCAKYQRATVRLTPEHQFTVNGKTIKDVDVSENGKRLKGCGQMVGASADNGKDPNLTDMGSTTKTAPIIGYMLRAGLSHLEASLLINQPLMLLSGHSSSSKEWGILGKRPLAVPIENITTEMLIKNIVSPDELTPAQQMAINGVCYRILMQHEAQEYLTQISRADSPNGSIQNNYAKARIQRYKVDLFQAKMGQRGFPFVRINEALSNDAVDTKASEDVVREQLKAQPMAFLHGMYALGIKSFNDLVSPYFFGAQEWFDNGIVKPILYNMNERDSDTKKEEVVNNIYKSYITYILSGSSLFGNEENASMKSKRDYYLETFPSDYQKILHENEDIRNLLGNILQVKNFGSRKRVILQDVGSLSKGLKQDVQRRFEALMYSKNPVAKKLASDLLLYSYFDNGLQFTHDSFSHLFTTLYLTSFSAYTEGLNDLDTEISPEEQTNFIMQFLLTYPNAAYKADKIVKEENLSEGGNKITLDLNNPYVRDRIINEVMSPNPQSEGINVYPYISYNAEVYVLDTESGNPVVYNKLERYRTFQKLPLFSRQMSVKELSREFPLDAEYNEQVMPIEEDSPVSYNDSDTDSAVDEGNIYSKVENTDSFSVDIDPSDFTNIPETKTEKYENEGNGKLQDPFCK